MRVYTIWFTGSFFLLFISYQNPLPPNIPIIINTKKGTNNWRGVLSNDQITIWHEYSFARTPGIRTYLGELKME
jgi:hypothetical protein